MGRLAPDVDPEQASAALTVGYRQLLHEDVKTARLSEAEKAQFLEKSLNLVPGGRGRSGLRGQFATPLVVLMAMVGLVLLIACANVANLLLAKAATQQKDVAIRLALGAGRFRVVRQRLAESLLLAAGGALVAVVFAWWTTSLLIEILPFDRAALTLASYPDLRLVLFAIGLAGGTALLSGLAPALHATKPQLTGALKEEARGVAGTRSQTRFRKGLVVAQVALSVLLLAGAGLFARSFYNLRAVDPGFVPANLIQFTLRPALSGYTREQLPALFRTLEDQLNALPGVTSVSLAVVPAMANASGRQTVRVQGYMPAETEDMSPNLNV
ncbi:MAG: FtsX-like permease family protein, partial [Ardenticatenaceae bacterium]